MTFGGECIARGKRRVGVTVKHHRWKTKFVAPVLVSLSVDRIDRAFFLCVRGGHRTPRPVARAYHVASAPHVFASTSRMAYGLKTLARWAAYAAEHADNAQYALIPIIILIGMHTTPKPSLFQVLSPV